MGAVARGTAGRVAIALVAVLLLGGCAAADKNAAMSTSTPAGGTGGSAGMAGMDMGASAGSASGSAAGSIKPVPTQVLGTASWQGMRITAQAMTAVPFVVYNGASERTVKPGDSSFHLMVMLNDADTNVPIPYASVWATITKNGKVVFDERQWPMISRYMGPHYGNDVSLPGAGTYQLTLLVSPPVSARHVEYQDVWLKPHRVTFSFPWKPAS
jgi:Fe2+ transport protein